MSWWEDQKAKVMGPVQAVADKTGLPDVKPPVAQSEEPGKTVTGGRRVRKTRKHKHQLKEDAQAPPLKIQITVPNYGRSTRS
jgi:hypothetical protein